MHLDKLSSDPAPVQSVVPQGVFLGLCFSCFLLTTSRKGIGRYTDVSLMGWSQVLYSGGLNHPCVKVFIVTRKKNKISHPCTIHGYELALDKTVICLGVNMNETLSWNDHILQISKWAHNTISFLLWNTSICPRSTKAISYTTVVRPLVECGIVRDPETQVTIKSQKW